MVALPLTRAGRGLHKKALTVASGPEQYSLCISALKNAKIGRKFTTIILSI